MKDIFTFVVLGFKRKVRHLYFSSLDLTINLTNVCGFWSGNDSWLGKSFPPWIGRPLGDLRNPQMLRLHIHRRAHMRAHTHVCMQHCLLWALCSLGHVWTHSTHQFGSAPVPNHFLILELYIIFWAPESQASHFVSTWLPWGHDVNSDLANEMAITLWETM